jgi:predicted O-methyltransferase YrrM
VAGWTGSKDEMFALVARAADAGVFNLNRESLDVLKMASVIATYESARFYTRRMTRARAFERRADLLAHAVSLAPTEGLVLEFGVGAGTSIKLLAGATRRTIHGFDSFDGLPEDWRTGFEAGAFRQEGVPRDLGANVELVVGLFADTLPGFLATHDEPAALVHVDCDLYGSTKTVFDALGPRIGSGTVLVFDEYFNFPGWQEGEHKAFAELLADRALGADYFGFVRAGSQVAARIV